MRRACVCYRVCVDCQACAVRLPASLVTAGAVVALVAARLVRGRELVRRLAGGTREAARVAAGGCAQGATTGGESGEAGGVVVAHGVTPVGEWVGGCACRALFVAHVGRDQEGDGRDGQAVGSEEVCALHHVQDAQGRGSCEHEAQEGAFRDHGRYPRW